MPSIEEIYRRLAGEIEMLARIRNTVRSKLPALFGSLVLGLATSTAVQAYPEGYTTGASQCAGCHVGPTTNTSVVASSGTLSVVPGASLTLNVAVSNSTGTGAAFNSAVYNGSSKVTLGSAELISGNGVQIMNGEFTHTGIQAASSGAASFSFIWKTPPSIPVGSVYTIKTVGLATQPGGFFAAEWNAGNDLTITFAAPAAATLNLAPAWNLVGNGSSGSLDVATVLGNNANVNTVWKWVAASTKWAFYTPALGTQELINYAAGKGYDVLSSLDGGDGFWVNAKQAFSVQLPAGSAVQASAFMPSGAKPLGHAWSLVATGEAKTPGEFNVVLSGLSTVPANPADIPVNLTTLWAWDATQAAWYFYAPSLEKTGGLASYIAGKGYLDFSANNKKLGQGVGFWVNMP